MGGELMSRLVDLQVVPDAARGTLVVMEAGRQVPFEFSRVFMLCDVPRGALRGDHAHRKQHQFLVAASGAFSIELEDRGGTETYRLDRPMVAAHVPPLTWLKIRSEAPGSTCMVLASALFDEADYIRDRSAFDALIKR